MALTVEIGEEQAEKLWRLYRNDPCIFSSHVLGRDPWDDGSGESQADVLRACAHNSLVSVRSGHKVGKTGGIAILALWAYALFDPCSVIMTAPTHRQVQKMAWKETRALYKGARVPLGGRLYDTASAGLRYEDPADGSVREVFGFSTNDPDLFSGFSGPNVFYMVDEAPGVDEAIFEAIDGNRAGGASLWMFGNPTQNVGTFYESFHELSELYVNFHVSSERVAAFNETAKILGLATQWWIDERRVAWTPNNLHPAYIVRVNGDFPPEGARQVISLVAWKIARMRYDRLLERANGDLGKLNDVLYRAGHPLVAGLDVARFGDDATCLAPRRGDVLFPISTTANRDGPQVAAWAMSELSPWLGIAEGVKPGTRKPTVNIDAIGVGASAYDSLVRDPECTAVPIITSESSDEPEEYANLRAQVWFNTAKWLATRGAVPNDPALRVELCAVRYKLNAKGLLALESKDETKARIKRSPDRGDATVLSAYRAADPNVDDAPGRGRRKRHEIGMRIRGL